MTSILFVLSVVPHTGFPIPHGILPLIGIIILVVLVLAVLKAMAGSKGKADSKDFPYESRKVLLTPAERSFMGVLEQALEEKLHIMAKVRLADVVEVKSGLTPRARGIAFNRIQSKHLDFVVCDPKDFSILCAIELDDSSHAQKRRQNRDELVDDVMNAAGIKLHRFPVKQGYVVAEVRKVVVG